MGSALSEMRKSGFEVMRVWKELYSSIWIEHIKFEIHTQHPSQEITHTHTHTHTRTYVYRFGSQKREANLEIWF